MKLKRAHEFSLQTLNEDCLHRIFSHLNLCEQYAVLQLSSQHFEESILRIWRSKYAKSIDLQRESKFKLLTDADLLQLLSQVAGLTRELLNFDELLWQKFLNVQGGQVNRSCFPNIAKITIRNNTEKAVAASEKSSALTGLHVTFPQLRTLHLSCMQIAYEDLCAFRNLSDLQLIRCTAATSTPSNGGDSSDDDHEGLREVFHSLRLKQFTYLPHTNARKMVQQQMIAIRHCTSLQMVALSAVALTATTLNDIATKLPNLQELAIYTESAEATSGAASETQTDTGLDNATVVTVLTMAKGTQIAGVRLKCHFDRRLLRQLYLSLPNLSEFAWHSHLHVDYDGKVGVAKWQTHDPQVTREVLKLIERCCRLKLLDFRWNRHVTREFIAKVRSTLEARDVKKVVQMLHDQQCVGDSSSADTKCFAEEVYQTKEIQRFGQQLNYGYMQFKFNNEL